MLLANFLFEILDHRFVQSGVVSGLTLFNSILNVQRQQRLSLFHLKLSNRLHGSILLTQTIASTGRLAPEDTQENSEIQPRLELKVLRFLVFGSGIFRE